VPPNPLPGGVPALNPRSFLPRRPFDFFDPPPPPGNKIPGHTNGFAYHSACFKNSNDYSRGKKSVKGTIIMFQNTLSYRGTRPATAFSHIQVKGREVVMVCIVKNAQSLKGLLTARHNDLPVF